MRHWNTSLLALVLFSSISVLHGEPAPRAQDPQWVAQHSELADKASKLMKPDVVFFGDSLTEGWLGLFDGQPNKLGKDNSRAFDGLGKRLGVGMHVFGIAGDTVEDLMWRVQNGEFPFTLEASLAVVCIGINDILHGASTRETAQRIRGLITKMQAEHPTTRFLLMGLLPESSGTGSVVPDERPSEVNSWLLKMMQDHSLGPNVDYVDCKRYLTNRQGILYPTNYIEDSEKYLHLSTDGYKALTYCLYPLMNKALKPGQEVVPKAQAPAADAAMAPAAPATGKLSAFTSRPLVARHHRRAGN